MQHCSYNPSTMKTDFQFAQHFVCPTINQTSEFIISKSLCPHSINNNDILTDWLTALVLNKHFPSNQTKDLQNICAMHTKAEENLHSITFVSYSIWLSSIKFNC